MIRWVINSCITNNRIANNQLVKNSEASSQKTLMQLSRSINRVITILALICLFHQDQTETEWYNLPIKIIDPRIVKTI